MSVPTGMPMLEHTYAEAVPDLSLPWEAAAVESPELLVLDEELAAELGLDPDWLRSPEGLQFLVGRVPGQGTVAQAYAGHQFGHYSPVLGDGRALLLGEVAGSDGTRRDLHLKGSGRTPFARGGDGLAAVGPMLREHVMATAMHGLRIPTTRSLAVVATGRAVQRERPLPGAVLCRVASSHLRVGTFQYAAATRRLDVLRALADHAIDRHHPQARDADDPYLALFEGVARAQARLVAQWMGVGFVHGVMNTDNTTISGETIDYGPCAFLDTHDPNASFSSIDHGGRYAYGNQPGIAQWNLARLGEALLPLLGRGAEDDTTADDGTTEITEPDPAAVEAATDVLHRFAEHYRLAFGEVMRAKLGLPQEAADAAPVGEEADRLVTDVLALITREKIDHTLFFRGLTEGSAAELFTSTDGREAYDAWAARRRTLLGGAGQGAAGDHEATDVHEEMSRHNPIYVPRNHVVEQGLVEATDGDLDEVRRLTETLRDPYRRRPNYEDLEGPAPAGSAPYVTYCGT